MATTKVKKEEKQLGFWNKMQLDDKRFNEITKVVSDTSSEVEQKVKFLQSVQSEASERSKGYKNLATAIGLTIKSLR